MIALKFLRAGGIGPFSGVRWPADGEWLWATEGGGTCLGRVHACRAEDLPDWIDDELWRVELDGDVRVDCGKLVADRGRLVERVDAWDVAVMAEFAEACALRARDAALAALGPGPARDALASCTTGAQLAAAATRQDGLDEAEARAASYAGDAARHALAVRDEPAAEAPAHAAVNGFIAAHAAASAGDDRGAVARERAWQAAWLARRLAL